jgi:hypothetical protein
VGLNALLTAAAASSSRNPKGAWRVIKVDGNGVVRGGLRPGARTSAGAASGDFAARLAGGTSARAGVSGGMPINAASALIGLQTVEDATSKRRRATRRASSLLDSLEDIRLGLLQGGLPRAEVEKLGQLVAEARADVDDPQLANLLDEIDLRAQVELAKLEVAASLRKA